MEARGSMGEAEDRVVGSSNLPRGTTLPRYFFRFLKSSENDSFLEMGVEIEDHAGKNRNLEESREDF